MLYFNSVFGKLHIKSNEQKTHNSKTLTPSDFVRRLNVEVF